MYNQNSNHIPYNFQTLDRDATTPIIRALGSNGISYATYVQVENQQTARIVPIDGTLPTEQTYPLRRQLYYVYKTPPSPSVEAFLGFATSPKGQLAIATIEWAWVIGVEYLTHHHQGRLIDR